MNTNTETNTEEKPDILFECLQKCKDKDTPVFTHESLRQAWSDIYQRLPRTIADGVCHIPKEVVVLLLLMTSAGPRLLRQSDNVAFINTIAFAQLELNSSLIDSELNRAMKDAVEAMAGVAS